MILIDRLIAWLDLRRANDSPANIELHSATKILREVHTSIDAEALALRAAVDNGPDGTVALASVEQQLKAAYGGALTRIEALFAPAVGALDARLAQLLARMSTERLDAVARACSVEHARLRAQSLAPLVALRRTERRTQRAFRAFRFRHRLTREARYPESRTLHYSALALVCVLEAVANTAAFAEGSELGLAGGFLNGLLVAVTNVAFAFFAGRAAIGLFHRHWKIKALTAFILSGWAAFESIFAFAVAHYRIALVAAVDTAPKKALESLITAPFAIGDLISILLTVFTISFGFAALLAGLSTDDCYPGYGSIDRTRRRAMAQLRNFREATLGALDAIFLPASAQLRAITQEAISIQDAYRQTLESMKRTSSILEHTLGEINAAYREALLSARAAFNRVSGVPLAAGEPSALGSSTLLTRTHGRIEAATSVLRHFPASVSRLETEKAATEARVQRAHERALEAMPAFFASADKLAEHETDHDETDVPHAGQHTPWGREINLADSAPQKQAPGNEDAPEQCDTAKRHQKTKVPHKGNGSGELGQERGY